MDRLLNFCHASDVHHVEGVLGDTFLEFEVGVSQGFSVSQMQAYVTDLSLPMKKLFGMHVKAGNGKKMQLLAQKLYKKEGDKKYVFWIVGSMLQQMDLPPMMLTVTVRADTLHAISVCFNL